MSDDKKKGLKDFSTYHYNPFRIDSKHIRSRPVDKVVGKMPYVDGEVKGTITITDGQKTEVADFQDHIRLFSDCYSIIPRLSAVALKILSYIFQELPKGSDEVNLNIQFIMASIQINNRASIYNGIINLLEENIIVRKTGGDSYYINPALIFKNTRREWYQKTNEFDKTGHNYERIYTNKSKLK